jgi:hypothetical protein
VMVCVEFAIGIDRHRREHWAGREGAELFLDLPGTTKYLTLERTSCTVGIFALLFIRPKVRFWASSILVPSRNRHSKRSSSFYFNDCVPPDDANPNSDVLKNRAKR